MFCKKLAHQLRSTRSLRPSPHTYSISRGLFLPCGFFFHSSSLANNFAPSVFAQTYLEIDSLSNYGNTRSLILFRIHPVLDFPSDNEAENNLSKTGENFTV